MLPCSDIANEASLIKTPHGNSHSFAFLNSRLKKLERIFKKTDSAADKLSTVTSIAGAGAYGLQEIDLLVLPDATSLGIGLGWGYSEGVYAFISGINFLLDTKNQHRIQNKAKGILQIISSVQLFLLTYHPYLLIAGSSTTLGGFGFAFSTLVESINAGIELTNSCKKMIFIGWLEETLAEIKHLNCANKRNESEKLIHAVISRCRIDYNLRQRLENESEPREKKSLNFMKRDKKIDAILDKFATHINTQQIKTEYKKKYVEFSYLKTNDITHNYEIKRKCRADLKNNLLNFIIKTLMFTGMTLIAASVFFPMLALPGVILFAIGFICSIAFKIKECKPRLPESCRFFSSKPAKENNFDLPSQKLLAMAT